MRPLPGMNGVRDVHHKDGAFGVRVQPAPDDAAPRPALIGVSRSPGNARPHFGQRWLWRCERRVRGYPMYSVPGTALPSWSFSTNTGNRPSLNRWCRAHLMPVCRSIYMSVQTTQMNRRPEPCFYISPALSVAAAAVAGPTHVQRTIGECGNDCGRLVTHNQLQVIGDRLSSTA